jgi:type III secretory pathway component EscV
MKISNTTWTLIATCVVLAGNAILPVVPQSVSSILGTILAIFAIFTHKDDVNTAVAAAKAPSTTTTTQ